MHRLVVLKAIARGVRDGRLTAGDCRLLLCVGLVQAFALAGVAYAPVPAVRKTLARFRRLAIALSGAAPEPHVIWAIDASARYAHSTCLARALAAELLLPLVDRPLTVIVGVTSAGVGQLKSHAWIERDGCVLIGGAASRREYLPLIAWTGRTA